MFETGGRRTHSTNLCASPETCGMCFCTKVDSCHRSITGVSLNVRLPLVTKCNGYFSRGDYYLGVIKQEQVNERLV